MPIKGEEKNNSWLLRSIVILGLVLFGLIVFAVSRETYKKKQVEAEINKLKEEAKSIEKENLELADKISYLESKDYQEKEAKDKLNLQDPKENLVVVKPNAISYPEAEPENKTQDKKLIVKISNVQKWWDYFFKH
ncbi:MAG TPA: septum formation initiator family protein [Candidatus Moranbacteria bacterium]|nr:septum formation initiator family protein [Candidatus Moranbacteria bacterium]